MDNNLKTNTPPMWHLLICLFLASITIAVYQDVRNYDLTNYDDDVYVNSTYVEQEITFDKIISVFRISENPLHFYWHPVTWLTHMINSRIFGLNAGAHHLINAVIHILNALLLYAILFNMTGGMQRSAFVAALFAVHPLAVESVAWVAQLKNVLSAFFWMLTLLAYVQYAKQPGFKRYMFILLPFVLGMMTKPILLTLPCVLLILDYWPLGRMDLFHVQTPKPMAGSSVTMTGRLILEKIPLFLLSIAGAGISIYSVRVNKNITTEDLVPMALRMENALVSYLKYPLKLIWPHDLAPFYPFPGSIPLWQPIAAAIMLLSVSVFALLLIKKAPYLITGWLWYLGTLFPAIGIFQQGRWPAMADRFVYIPMIGLMIMLVWAGVDILKKTKRPAFYFLTAAAVILLLCISAKNQVSHWRNSKTLFKHTIAVTTDNFVGNYNLAQVLAAEGKGDKAYAHYLNAQNISETAGTNLNIGSLLLSKGRIDEAIHHFKRSLLLKDTEEAHTCLAKASAAKGLGQEAEAHFVIALSMNPDSIEALNGIGNLFLQNGRPDEAIPYFARALQIDPDSAEIQNNMGNAFLNKGMIKEAATRFQRILQSDPLSVEANINMGVALTALNDVDAAIAHYQTALASAPDSAQAHNNLGVLLVHKKRYSDAMAHFRAALKFKPDYASAASNIKKLQELNKMNP